VVPSSFLLSSMALYIVILVDLILCVADMVI
jgi:hypothetical protein